MRVLERAEREETKMSDEDKTRTLPENKDPADKITKPGVEAILDRINKLGDELRGENRQLREEMLGAINKLGEELRGEIQQLGEELRKEMHAGFDLLNRKLRILAGEDLNSKAEIENLLERIAELERKAS